MTLPARRDLDALHFGPAHQARNVGTRCGPEYAAGLPVYETAEIMGRCGANVRVEADIAR